LRAKGEGEVKTAAQLARHVMPLASLEGHGCSRKEDSCVRAAFRPGG
jgi:hypothetical protein